MGNRFLCIPGDTRLWGPLDPLPRSPDWTDWTDWTPCRINCWNICPNFGSSSSRDFPCWVPPSLGLAHTHTRCLAWAVPKVGILQMARLVGLGTRGVHRKSLASSAEGRETWGHRRALHHLEGGHTGAHCLGIYPLPPGPQGLSLRALSLWSAKRAGPHPSSPFLRSPVLSWTGLSFASSPLEIWPAPQDLTQRRLRWG